MEKLKAVVIGTGFGGLCMGIKLKQAGIDSFVILEKESALGGTWRENTYPGAECDIPSALYSYSFEHNADWQFRWAGQAQILKYQNDTAQKYDLQEFIRFGQKVCRAVFNEDQCEWHISTESGEEYVCQHLVTSVGQLHHPYSPAIEGEDRYRGERFHSAQWNHSVSLKGKKVGVIGNAASAVQFIPEIVDEVDQLTVFQRSANWTLPKINRPYSSWEQRLSEKVPLIAKMIRARIWALGEYGLLPAIKGNKLARWCVKAISLRNLRKQVQDPELIKKLTPSYPVGAKRILFTDRYYPALCRDNVHLETDGIESFTEGGVRCKNATEYAFDVVIDGTGFKTNPFLADMDIVGVSSLSLREHWSDGAYAYLGLSTHGFPNFHMMYGPNTNLGHSSIIIMLEAQANQVVRSILYLEQAGKQSLEVRERVEQDYNHALQQRLATLAFSEVEHSWYMDGNKITNNWAGGTKEYRRRVKNIGWNDYKIT